MDKSDSQSTHTTHTTRTTRTTHTTSDHLHIRHRTLFQHGFRVAAFSPNHPSHLNNLLHILRLTLNLSLHTPKLHSHLDICLFDLNYTCRASSARLGIHEALISANMQLCTL